jgi:hypothetical protein
MRTEAAATDALQRLVEDITAKLVAHSTTIERSQGKIVLHIYRRGAGWDVQLRVTL